MKKKSKTQKCNKNDGNGNNEWKMIAYKIRCMIKPVAFTELNNVYYLC